jgi:predicted porin
MKKTLVALAALAATSAFAQSSVSIYGVMDVGPNVVSSTAATGVETTTSNGNGSGAWQSNRLGFRGTEDLGGGMKADFQYELGMAAATTGDLVTTGGVRLSHLTLSGSGMGSLNFGRNYNPIFFLTADVDPGAANNLANGRTVYGQIATTRTNGLATYTSPTIAGFTAKLATGTNTAQVGTATTGSKVMGGSLIYKAGPLMVGYGMNNVDQVSVTGDRDESVLGATYQLGSATLLAMTGTLKVKDAAGAQASKRTGNQIGIRYPFGKISTYASYGTQVNNTLVGSADVKSTAYQVGAMYNFSKRTGAYIAQGSTKNDTGPVKGSELAVGIRHSF